MTRGRPLDRGSATAKTRHREPDLVFVDPCFVRVMRGDKTRAPGSRRGAHTTDVHTGTLPADDATRDAHARR
jgi:hypothetical protein